ncbi:hypothetical protein Bca52824_014206 [Brassica carinata]|uniref:Uncharacterized protein n=1 Tax=Brassica carinata TaxID=52824 RepID=A0A8X8B473_BRACI|nr:hypothetical protein Bca52824_014206 [Brassica carinata]
MEAFLAMTCEFFSAVGLGKTIQTIAFLAGVYGKTVTLVKAIGGGGPEEEELIVQGVRFAFPVHQFAGGFDAETMRAFQELRDKARSCHISAKAKHINISLFFDLPF